VPASNAAIISLASIPRLPKAVAGRGVEIEAVDALEIGDPAPRLLVEGRLSLEGVQRDPFQQVTPRKKA
jgi:hypothetical protein